MNKLQISNFIKRIESMAMSEKLHIDDLKKSRTKYNSVMIDSFIAQSKVHLEHYRNRVNEYKAYFKIENNGA